MTRLDPPPVPERELPADRRAAIRGWLVTHATATRTAKPVPMTRRRLVLAAASVAAVLALVQLWPTSVGDREDPPVPDYVAAWSPIPTPVDADTADRLGDGCRATMLQSGPSESAPLPADGWDEVIVDRRGDTAIVLLAHPSVPYAMSCFYRDIGQHVSSGVLLRYSRLADGESLVPVETSYSFSEHDGVAVGHSFGQAAADVARVAIALSDGTDVRSTLADGWYLAWWPGRAAAEEDSWPYVDPSAEWITAYDAAGTILAQHDADQGV